MHPLAGDGGAGVKLVALSVFFRVIPWQMRFTGLINDSALGQADAKPVTLRFLQESGA
jgi:hypothetical protein